MTDLPKYPGPRLVPLLDGSLVFDDSEEYRHLMEARWIARLPYTERSIWLFDLDRIRGTEETDRLRRTIEEVIAVAAQNAGNGA
jgi:hypothetical protein